MPTRVLCGERITGYGVTVLNAGTAGRRRSRLETRVAHGGHANGDPLAGCRAQRDWRDRRSAVPQPAADDALNVDPAAEPATPETEGKAEIPAFKFPFKPGELAGAKNTAQPWCAEGHVPSWEEDRRT